MFVSLGLSKLIVTSTVGVCYMRWLIFQCIVTVLYIVTCCATCMLSVVRREEQGWCGLCANVLLPEKQDYMNSRATRLSVLEFA